MFLGKLYIQIEIFVVGFNYLHYKSGLLWAMHWQSKQSVKSVFYETFLVRMCIKVKI
jgi:hypothetical protein